MSSRSLEFAAAADRSSSRAALWLELSKPRMVGLILVTTVAGFTMGSAASLDYLLLVHTLVGTALAAAGCLALNQVMEERTDALMERTARRPLPSGRIGRAEALAFGAAASCAGLAYLALAVNPLSSLVTASVLASYLLLYTPMKSRSALCTVVGAIPGALPPVAGWAAASGRLGVGAAVLFGIMFFWQIPHSLAIAWLYRDDYKKAGLKLLSTIEETSRSTNRHVVINAVLLLAVGLLPAAVGLTGWIYPIVAFVMGAWMLAGSVAMARGGGAMEPARRVLRTSFLYVPVVLLAMTLDRIPLPW